MLTDMFFYLRSLQSIHFIKSKVDVFAKTNNIFISQSGSPIMVSSFIPRGFEGSTSSSEFHFPLAFDEKAAALAMRMLQKKQ